MEKPTTDQKRIIFFKNIYASNKEMCPSII